MFTDPGRVNLRKASRAAIVTPALFAIFDVVVGNDATALFASFASFAALVFCDFGGTLIGRARAYAAVLVTGTALVALGTACSEATVAAISAMAVVAFAVVFVGALGGYFSASTISVILAFVLAVMLPAPVDQLWERELGWIVGVAVAGLCALILWPLAERVRVRGAAAGLAETLADHLEHPGTTASSALAAARRELDASVGVVFRPAGSASRDRALVSLVRELRLAQDFARLPTTHTDADADADLLAASAAMLRTIAGSIRTPAAVLDVGPLVRSRAANTAQLVAWARSPEAHADPDDVVARFDREFPMRALSLRVLAISAYTAAHSGAELTGIDAAVDEAPADLRFFTTPVGGVGVWRRLAEHWSLDSVRLRAALRTAIGLAAAVGIGKAFDIDHAFWVALGTLSVLRSNAFGTGVTALQAVVGTLVGFGVVTACMTVVGGDTTALWIALPVTVFLSGYTPGAVHFVVGQASFTVFVVVLFNLIEPLGWRTGLVRLEDIAIGVGISLVVGVLLWPRGARAAARETFERLLRVAVRSFRSALDHLVGAPGSSDVPSASDVDVARAAVLAARDRAVAALEDLTVERGGGQVDRDSWLARLEVANLLLLAGDGLERMARDGPLDGCAEARRALARDGLAVDAAVGGLASDLEHPPLVAFDAPATTELCDCLVEAARNGADVPIRLLWARELVGAVEQRLVVPSGRVPDEAEQTF